MWIVQQRDPAGDWFVRATVEEQQAAEDLAQLYKAHNPKLRFRYYHVDEEGEPLENFVPIEV